MNIQIKDYFAPLKVADAQLVSEAEKKKDEIEKLHKEKCQEIERLESEKSKKEKILRNVNDEDVDVSKLTGKIIDLEFQIKNCGSEIESLKRQYENLQTKPKDFLREDLLVSLLKNVYKCSEAVVFENQDDFLASIINGLSINVSNSDSEGCPLECNVQIDANHQMTVKINSGNNHFLKNFRPKSLEWLPIHQPDEISSKASQHPKKEFCAYVLKDSNRLFLSNTKIEWSTHKSKAKEIIKCEYWHNDRDGYHNNKDDFADLAGSWPDLLKEILNSNDEPLDLNKKYEPKSVLNYIKKQVVEMTNPEPSFKACKEQLTSQEIYQKIKADWDAFSGCPWSADIKGRLALLKFYVENGERARFWSTEFDGHYGFRLRTRDHDWIVGTIFILSAEKPATQKTIIQVIKKGEGYEEHGSPIIKLGRMLLRCWHG